MREEEEEKGQGEKVGGGGRSDFFYCQLAVSQFTTETELRFCGDFFQEKK